MKCISDVLKCHNILRKIGIGIDTRCDIDVKCNESVTKCYLLTKNVNVDVDIEQICGRFTF